ncbi:MAG: hypothetical protein Aurels2KO_53290 [Aureliella sp.]
MNPGVTQHMSFFAQFERHERRLFRLDTRIYLHDDVSPSSDDQCVAAVIAKNPGSAVPTKLGKLTRLTLDGDKLLPTVRNRFIDAYSIAKLDIPTGAFVRVWNLLYLCNPTLTKAIAEFATVSKPVWCKTEKNAPPIVWFAWGPPKAKLDEYKQRFLSTAFDTVFYFDMDSEKVVAKRPALSSRVKHTQGMPKAPINKHLAALIAG